MKRYLTDADTTPYRDCPGCRRNHWLEITPIAAECPFCGETPSVSSSGCKRDTDKQYMTCKTDKCPIEGKEIPRSQWHIRAIAPMTDGFLEDA